MCRAQQTVKLKSAMSAEERQAMFELQKERVPW